MGVGDTSMLGTRRVWGKRLHFGRLIARSAMTTTGRDRGSTEQCRICRTAGLSSIIVDMARSARTAL